MAGFRLLGLTQQRMASLLGFAQRWVDGGGGCSGFYVCIRMGGWRVKGAGCRVEGAVGLWFIQCLTAEAQVVCTAKGGQRMHRARSFFRVEQQQEGGGLELY